MSCKRSSCIRWMGRLGAGIALLFLMGALLTFGTHAGSDQHVSLPAVHTAPLLLPERGGAAQLSSPVAALHTASFATATLVIPTYPYTPFLEAHLDPYYNMVYHSFDRAAYEASHPLPSSREYTLLVLENDALRVTLLPELGGRIYQLFFKPTGHNELYNNPVIKPTRWGPLIPEENWWLAAGGIEWCLPVEEHGYEWGVPWSWSVVSSTYGVTVTVRDTQVNDRLRAAIDIYLPANRAFLAVTPHLENPTAAPVTFKYWVNGMLAPGEANTVGPDLHFIFNAQRMTVHSAGDPDLPAPGQPMDWPVHDGRNYARLGNWRRWLGFFERPQAAAGFAGVYDTAVDEGLVRVFPLTITRGMKGFAFGWSDPIDWHEWTDDGSTYVELHGGLAPTFWDSVTLSPTSVLSWTEMWYPASGIGTLSAATAEAALGVQQGDGGFSVGVHTTAERTAGEVYAWGPGCTLLSHAELPAMDPALPFTMWVPAANLTPEQLSVAYVDGKGRLLAGVNPIDCLPPDATVEPLPPWVTAESFSVTWSGTDTWEGIAAYDVQARDGCEGEWVDWLTGTLTTTASFTGLHGHTYFFRARAVDREGNWGLFDDEEWGQAFTTVLTEPAPVLVTSRKEALPTLFLPGQAVSYTLYLSNTGNLAATTTITDTLPASMRLLSGTLRATSGPAPYVADGQIRWSGQVVPGEAVRVTYALSATQVTPRGAVLTNTVEVSGSVLGPLVRRESVVQGWKVWLPLILRL